MSDLVRLGFVLLVVGGLAACDDDGVVAPDLLDLELVEGLYSVLTLTFDPQGSAPAADILATLEEAGTSPTLNVGRTGEFQLFFRDPASGNITTLSGSVEAMEDGIELVFASQAAADRFLFPRRVPLEYDEATRRLSFSGSANVDRVRLQQLFPELYGEEPWTSETIPGILTVAFEEIEGDDSE